ncbi:Quino protein amine dehydrogenase [Aspergillus cavernicola]|uniref:Mitochondrial division protein 1 n=1 Tax=Aspergillus cavernicola TaxID=176166 RepID=A0ABR4HMD0_9EURO
MEPLSGAASIIAVVQLTETVIRICGTYISKVKDAKDGIIRLQQNTRALTVVLKALDILLHEPKGSELSTSQTLSSDIANCFSSLTSLKEQIDPEVTQRPMRRWGIRAIQWPLKRTELDKAISDIERMTTGLLVQKVDLNTLQVAKGAAFNDYDNQHAECLPGTRVELLDEIDNWTKISDGKCIFWLNGMAGTGKSTISRTIAGRLKGQNLLGASFFFKRGEHGRGNAKMLFSTLAKQLGVAIPQMIPGIRKAVEDDPDISERVLGEQFEKLVLHPLLSIKQGPTTTLVIVIDALDECDQEGDIQLILRLLPQVQKSNSIQLRFLLTSRPELPIRLGFKAVTNNYQDLVLHKIPKPVIERDLTLYFENKFSELRQERSYLSDWPGDRIIRTLVERAVPLFISATTLYRFISDKKRNPEKSLRAILSDEISYAAKMDCIYMPVLNQLLTGQDEQETEQLVEEFKDVVGFIILLATPLSVNTLARLLNKEHNDIRTHLDLFHSVLDIPTGLDEPVRILHLSFRDFLLDKTKKKSPFWVNEKEIHHKLTVQCLKAMQQERYGLRKNICNIEDNGAQQREIHGYALSHFLPPDLQYACQYWMHHLVQSHDPVGEITQAFLFLQSHFLHWIEAMSFLNTTSEVIEIIQKLRLTIQDDKDSKLSEFLYDAWRFLLKYRHIADTAPLQLYSSGLIFAPANSVIRKTFESELSAWKQLPKVEKTWSGELQTLEGHSSSVQSLAFSPYSQILAPGSGDHTIKLWDSSRGELRQTLKGHSDWVQSVSFSLNIKLWDLSTGELVQTLEGHSSSVWSVIFSPNSQLLASGSEDHTIKVWDSSTGELRQTLKGHSSSVWSVAFSSNNQLLASGSEDHTIKLWDSSMGELLQTLKGYSDWVQSVAFSLNGQLLVSGSRDHTIKLWDTSTGKLHQTLEGHSNQGHFCSVHSIAFSSNGQLLTSGSEDHTVKLWNTNTGELCQTFESHFGWVQSVAFSPNGQLLASGSTDHTIKLWNSITGELHQTLKGHSDWVQSVAFSPNGQLLVSGSEDHTIKLWDSSMGELLQSLKVSGSRDHTVKLWDPNTGELHQTLEGHSSPVQLVAFSQNNQLLASGSMDSTIKLWDTSTGELRQTLKGHSHWVWTGTHIDGLSIRDNQWTFFRGRSILWLPPNWRPSCLAFKDGILALGHASGRVSFISSFC